MSRRAPAVRQQVQTRHQAESLGRNVVSLEGGLAERKTHLYQLKVLRQELRDQQVTFLKARNTLLEEKEEYENDYAMAQEILESLRDEIRGAEAEANSHWAACANLRQRIASVEATARALQLAKSSFAGTSPSSSSSSSPVASRQRQQQQTLVAGSRATLDLLARLPYQAEAMGKTDLSARKAAALRLQEEAARGDEEIQKMQADIATWKSKITPLHEAIEEARQLQEKKSQKLERARSEVKDLLLRRRNLQSKLSLAQARRDRVQRVHSQLQEEADFGRGNIEGMQDGVSKELQETRKIFQLSSEALQQALVLHKRDTNKVVGSTVAHSRQLECCQVLPRSADYGSLPSTAATGALALSSGPSLPLSTPVPPSSAGGGAGGGGGGGGAGLASASASPSASPLMLLQHHDFQEPWRGLGKGREGLSPALPQISSSIVSSAGGWTCPLPSVAVAKPAAKLPKACGSLKLDGHPNPTTMVRLQGSATPRSRSKQQADLVLPSPMDLPASAR